MNASPQGPELSTVMHPVLGPVTYSASEPVPATNSGQSSPHSDTGTDVSPHDLIDEASDEIPRLTRLYADQTSEQDPLNTFARLHRVLLTDTHTDVSDLALIYGPMTQQASTAEDIKTLQLQCAGLLIDEASDEIPRLTRLYADQTSEQDPLNTFARLHRVLLTDTHTDVSDLALIYGPMTQQASTAEDIKTLQLQCAGLLARVEALEPLNEPTTHIPYPRDKQCARGYQKNIKQRSREQREARRDKIHLHI